jgi:two-component system cell cycle sensor histidine kinase/response regulator CckA
MPLSAQTTRDTAAQPPLAPEASTLSRLRGLLEVTQLVRDEADVPTLLAEVARTISDSLGYGIVVVNLYRPAWDDFEVVAVHGSEEARALLLGDTQPSETWSGLLDARFERRGAFLVPAGEYDWSAAQGRRYVPDSAAGDGPDAWRGEDELFVPMAAADGHVLGVLSVSQPASGRRPSVDELDVLVAVARHAAAAVEAAQAATRHAQRRAALERLVEVSSHLTGGVSVDAMLQLVCEDIRGSLGFDKVSIQLREPDGSFVARAAAGWRRDDEALQLDVGVRDVEKLLEPQFETEGCYLLKSADGEARVKRPAPYRSVNNGRGPHAWNHHWLVVPLVDGRQELAGVVLVDDPVDRLLPGRERLQVLRMFANQVTTALEFALQFEALDEANEARRTLINAAPVAIFDLNPDGIVRSWNRHAEEMFGWSADEAIGSPNPIVPAVEWSRHLEVIERVMAGEPHGAERLRLTKSGQLIHVDLSAAPVRDARGDVRGIVAVAVDLTERKRAEEELRRSRDLHRKVLDNSTDVISLLDLEGNVLFSSRSVEKVLGRTPEQIVGRPFGELVHPDDLEQCGASIARALAGEKVEPFNVRVRHEDGDWRLVEGVPVAVAGEDGRPEMLLSVARDVTERRHLEEELRQTQRIEAVGRLAGGIAHDFNNLLTAIVGYGELALSKLGEREPTARADVEQMNRAAERAAGLTHRLLAFSRRQVLQPTVLDLNSVVEEMHAMLARLLGEHVELCTRLDAEVGRVKADAGQLGQVVVNLALNGRDAMPKGGRLTIETFNVELDDEWATRHVGGRGGSFVALAVTDTGTGMDAATRERIFEPFFTTKGPGEGTGLGLATVYGIVKQSGGCLSVYSEEGRGTTFKIYLPRVDEETTPVRRTADDAAELGGTETILLVEDEQVVRTLVQEMLETAGYRVVAAETPARALELAQVHEGEIDLLLTDVVMPGMSGRDLADRLVAMRPGLRVLYTSGYTRDAISNQGVLESGTAFLEKPFSSAALGRAVRDALDA